MKAKIISVSASLLLLTSLSSCSFMSGMGSGMAAFMGGSPAYGTYGSSVPANWGNGYAGSTYSSDPVVNAAIITAQSDARLRSQGVNTSTSSSSSSSSSRSSSSSSDNGWYTCCASVPNFGIVTYHTCANCGKSHQQGSGHQCKKK